MAKEWSLDHYREFNDRLERRVGAVEDPKSEKRVVAAVDAKLLVNRLHRLAVRVSGQAGVDVRERAALMRELAEIADQVEEQLERASLESVDGFR